MGALKENFSQYYTFMLSKTRTRIHKISDEFLIKTLSKDFFHRVNERILNISLHARGYQNCCDAEKTGEANFIEILSRDEIHVALDIGANIGNYSRILLERLTCKVIAFEPLPEAYAELLKIKSSYGASKFECFNLALGSNPQDATLFFGKTRSEIATLLESNKNLDYVGISNANEVTVKVETLDNMIESGTLNLDRIDFIKIDVEGFEFQVLKGAVRAINQFKPKYIQLEHNRFHLYTQESIFRFAELLTDYELFQILPYKAGIKKRDPSDPLSNLFEYANFVFKRR